MSHIGRATEVVVQSSLFNMSQSKIVLVNFTELLYSLEPSYHIPLLYWSVATKKNWG